MSTLIRLAYGAAIATLIILVVAFGIRAAYPPPEEPRFPTTQPGFSRQEPALPPGVSPGAGPNQEELERFQREQQEYQARFEVYKEKRQPYRRNVFLIAGPLALAIIVAGALLSLRNDALRFGLLLGGVITFIYSFAQLGEDIGDVGPVTVLPVAAVGLVLLLLLGYRYMGERTAP